MTIRSKLWWACIGTMLMSIVVADFVVYTVLPRLSLRLPHIFLQPSNVLIIMFAVSGTAAVIGILSMLAMGHLLVVHPLEQLSAVVHNLVGQDYSSRVRETRDDELGQIAKALNDMAEKLYDVRYGEQTMEVYRRQLVANVSHDLRTPLAMLAGYIEALRDGVLPEGMSQDECLAIIQDKIRRLTELIDDLFLLSRWESRRFPMNPTTVEAAELLRQILARAYPDCETRGVRLEVDIPGSSQKILADPSAIERVVMNLMSNSLRYLSAGDMIRVGLRDRPSGVEIVFEDTGPGIPPDVVARVFERYYSFKPKTVATPSGLRTSARSADAGRVRDSTVSVGTGLGLAIVREIVEAHGGDVHVDARPGGGTRFFITLPRRFQYSRPTRQGERGGL